MRKLQVNGAGRRLLNRINLAGAGAVMLLGLAAASGQAQPTNDNFTNATVITGIAGSIAGSNLGATAEPGEPVIAGTGGGKSIWYRWTSPFTGTVNFNTEGSPFDTVLGVYTGTNVANLTLIAANDDVDFPVDLTSAVTFPVTNGVVYRIAVDGFEGNAGQVTLSWQQSGAFSSGNFFIATPSVPSVVPPGTTFHPAAQPNFAISELDVSGTPAANLRVTRTGGSSGRVVVTYQVTNVLYTNILQTNIYGTNILVTNFDSNMVVQSFTNTFVTNFFTSNLLQNYTPALGFYQCPQISGVQLPPGIQISGTNSGVTNVAISVTTSTASVTNGMTNCFNSTTTVSTNTTNAAGVVSITVSVTNIFCNEVVVTNIGPSATNGVDYISSTGTLTFNDYQMGVSLPVDVLGNRGGVNRLLLVKLTKAVLAPGETTSLAPPSLDAVGGSALVTLLATSLRGEAGGVDVCTTTNAIVNMAQSVFQAGENNVTVLISAVRVGTNLTAGSSVTYTVGGDPANPNRTANGFALQPGSDYANPSPTNANIPSSQPPGFVLATGTLNFPAGSGTVIGIPIQITPNNFVKFNEDLQVTLSNPQGCVLGQIPSATVTILFHNQPAGAVDRNHNPNGIPTSNPPFLQNPGANNAVYAAAVQPDGKTVFGGDFTAYNSHPQNRIARMNTDGSWDSTFLVAPNSGANGVVTCLLLQTNNNSIYIGGDFSSFNGTNRHSIARLNPNGSLDPAFNPGLGVNGTVWSMALQPDGKLLIAGDFLSVNGTNRNNIARLNTDGSLDTTFDPGIGPNDIINAIALQNGKVLIGGDFTTVDNSNFSFLARLNSDGSLDSTLNPGAGVDGSIFAIALQPNGQILIAGSFLNYNLISRGSLARLNADGSLDASFDPGSGADNTIYAMALQPDGNLLIGGQFASYNGTRRIGIARVLSYGSLDTSFMDTAYNQFAGLINNFAIQTPNFLFTVALQSDSNVIVGGSFSQAGGGGARDSVLPRLNITRLIGGSTPGPGNIGLANNAYTVDKFGGQAYITMVRTNGALGPASVTVTPNAQPAGAGAAAPGQDFQFQTFNPYWTTTYPGGGGSPSWDFADAYLGPNNAGFDDLVPPLLTPFDFGTADVSIGIINNPNSTGNLSLNIGVSQPQSTDIFFLGGENIPIGVALNPQLTAPLTIVDDTLQHGAIGFGSPTYTVLENATNATITVVRTNGADGPVSVAYATTTGGTAVPGSGNDYFPTNGTLTFNAGQTSKTFNVPIVNGNVLGPDKTVNLVLSIPTGGAVLAQSNAVLTIINDNFGAGHLHFTATNYTAHETDGSASISVSRIGGSQNIISVTFVSSDGTAANGTNYGAVSNTLTWNAGDVSIKSFPVPLIHDGLVTPNLTVKLALTNAVIAGVTNNANGLGAPTNATLTIINDDFFGKPTFSTASYNVNNNAGFATITVNRLGGSAQAITVNYSTVNGTGANPAFAGVDYTAQSGTFVFNPGEFSKTFTVPVTPKNSAVGNLNFGVVLSSPSPAGVTLGNPSSATVTIVDSLTFNQPPGLGDTTFSSAAGFNDTVYALGLQGDGRLLAVGDFTAANSTPRNRLARLNSDGTLDVKFSSAVDGADGSIRALDIQTDGAILIGGLFQTVNGVNRQHIGRLNLDGSLDESFDPGSGADNPVYSLAETFAGPVTSASNRRVVIGGSFVSVNGVSYNNFAQLNNDGSVDTTFSASGSDGTVYAVAVYSTNDAINGGKILIGGDFTQVNGVSRSHIARLNADGSLDTTFNPGAGPNDSVRAIAIQVDGGILIGGLFTSVGSAGLNRVARLNPNGQVDPLFNPATGANDVVTCITLQQDHKIVLGGAFTQANGVTRNRLTRLNADGSVDTGINFGAGADNFVSTVVIQSNDEIVLAGAFTQFDGVSRPRIARLYGRNELGAGTLQFTSAAYQVVQNVTNVVITVERDGGTTGPASVLFKTSDGTATNGVNYLGVTNTLNFPAGETFQSVNLPIISNNIIDIGRTVNLTLTNATGAVLGGQPSAVVTIINNNSGVNLSSPTYSVIKNSINGGAVITILRTNSTIGPASVDFFTITNGTAQPGLDFTMVSNTVFFADGQSSQTITVPVNNNGLVEGNRTVGLALVNPTNTLILSPSAATLTIVDNNLPPGDFAFAAPSFSVAETGGSAMISVVRTNGSVGQVSVNYATGGGTATAGLDYVPTNGSLTFQDGQVSKTFTVQVLHNPQVTGNQTVNLTLSNPTGGGQVLQPNPVPLTIVDVDFGLSFAQSAYFVSETNASLTIGVQRIGGTNGAVSVNYATSNVTAQAGTDYTTTSGTLNFASGEVFKTFNVPILRNPLITGNLEFLVNLSSPSFPGQLVTPSSTAVFVIDADTGFYFFSPTNSVLKTGGSVVISVLRSGNVSGPVSVNYSTTNGAGPGNALAGTNYVATSGVLTFADGQTSNTFSVPILNDNRVDGDLAFSNVLFNPTSGAQVLSTNYPEVVTIVDTVAGLSFTSSAYSVSENGVFATITAVRTGVTNSAVSVNYASSDGTAQAGNQYTAVSGTLNFTNGQTNASFNVPIIDKNVTGGSETVNLNLSSPSASAILASPNAAVLTILNNEGSLIVPAGSALTSESGPVNGAIDPGETVTLLLALRNNAGTNTANLTATLLATNGITSPLPATAVSYGVLVTNGPSVSRPFTFTASGTNGARINATLQLQDGLTNLGTVAFSYTLGRTTNSFTNNALITINDDAPATPYPSVINVSGINGTVNKVTATVSNLNHGNISDVSLLLVGPTGSSTLLMAKVGGNHVVSGATITFDDAGPALTASAPVSGTNRPTQFSTNIPFPASTNGPGLLPGPFGTTLSVFTNTNPNGAWSLYVLDDTALDAGAISNGWSLNFTTLGTVTPTVDLVAGLTAAPNPVVITSNVTYTISVTNAGPASATNVLLTDVLPAGVTLVSSNTTLGSWSGSGPLTWSIGTLAKDATASATLVVSTSASPGLITNAVNVTSDQAEAYAADNAASVVTSVNSPTADLAIGIADSPNPVLIGNNVTYVITVTNLGPATATNVIVSNTLPGGAIFVSVTPPGAATTNAGVITVTNNLGNLGNGATASFSIVATPTTPGTNTDTASVGSIVTDPLKANNKATVKTVVQSVPLGLSLSGNNLTFTWPVSAAGYTLQFSPTLSPPAWTTVTSPPTTIVNGQYTVTVSAAGGAGFYRLAGP